MGEPKHSTLCWECEWAAGKDEKCPWACRFEPVPGWKAVATKVRTDKLSKHEYVYSYDVYECPLFELLEIIKQRKIENVDLKAKWKKEKKQDQKAIIALSNQRTVEEIAFITGYHPRTIYKILQKEQEKEEI